MIRKNQNADVMKCVYIMNWSDNSIGNYEILEGYIRIIA